MLERKSPLSQKRILGKFGLKTEEAGLTIKEIKEFSFLEISCWNGEMGTLKSKFLELLSLEAFPEAGRPVAMKDGLMLRSAPGQFTYFGAKSPEDILRAMIGPEEGSAVSLSHSRCALRLSGPEVREVLKRGIHVDISENKFPVGANAFTEIHGLSVLLIRRSKGDYDLVFMRSSALNIWTWLIETAEQFGYEVISE